MLSRVSVVFCVIKLAMCSVLTLIITGTDYQEIIPQLVTGKENDEEGDDPLVWARVVTCEVENVEGKQGCV